MKFSFLAPALAACLVAGAALAADMPASAPAPAPAPRRGLVRSLRQRLRLRLRRQSHVGLCQPRHLAIGAPPERHGLRRVAVRLVLCRRAALEREPSAGPTAEVDLYGGIRPTFGPVNLDFGFIHYAYPGSHTQYYHWPGRSSCRSSRGGPDSDRSA